MHYAAISLQCNRFLTHLRQEFECLEVHNNRRVGKTPLVSCPPTSATGPQSSCGGGRRRRWYRAIINVHKLLTESLCEFLDLHSSFRFEFSGVLPGRPRDGRGQSSITQAASVTMQFWFSPEVLKAGSTACTVLPCKFGALYCVLEVCQRLGFRNHLRLSRVDLLGPHQQLPAPNSVASLHHQRRVADKTVRRVWVDG